MSHFYRTLLAMRSPSPLLHHAVLFYLVKIHISVTFSHDLWICRIIISKIFVYFSTCVQGSVFVIVCENIFNFIRTKVLLVASFNGFRNKYWFVSCANSWTVTYCCENGCWSNSISKVIVNNQVDIENVIRDCRMT